MSKHPSVETLENQVHQITIADLANSTTGSTDTDVIEFNDVELSLELFKNCFFNNTYRFFELNSQYSDLAELKIHNKTIKSASFKNYKNGTKLDLLDIMSYKFIKNKKTKMSDVSKMYLVKDLSSYNSLLDFKIYNAYLSFDNIVSFYNQHINRKNKKYFRFKIKASYYSSDLDETLSLYFNYLVKVPKKSKKSKELVDNNEDDTFEYNTLDENTDSSSSINEPFRQALLDTNKVNKLENMVYSNYKKANKDPSTRDLVPKTNESINDDDENDDDAASESNMSDSSFEINESDDPFF